jgi:tRNA threonylcarbamoyladenosine biosynthesis protein TsaE
LPVDVETRVLLFVIDVRVRTKSSHDTVELGKKIGRLLGRGDVVALVGELGTGKTHLIKGLAAGAGVNRFSYVSSPSFTLIQEYPGKLPVTHVDLFRLNMEREAEDLGLEEYFQGRGITVIEWADKIPSLLPQDVLWIHLSYTGERTRSIEIFGKGCRYEEMVDNLVKLLKNKVPKNLRAPKDQ